MRPATPVAYNRHFENFMLFCTVVSFQIESISVEQLLVYCEFLYSNSYSPSAIANAMAGVKSRLQSYGFQVSVFSDVRITFYLKSLKLQQPLRDKLPCIIDFALLRKIIHACDKFSHPVLFKSIYLVAFYSFLRISNLVPHSVVSFSPLEKLARGDVFFGPPGLLLLIKWSKSMQNRNKAMLIKLPSIFDRQICPVYHVHKLLQITPGHQDSPLFQIEVHGTWVPLTDSRVRKHFKSILTFLQLHDRNITFHSFRKSGASLAFQGQTSLQSIKAHGTRSSDTVWIYIVQNQDGSAEVAQTLTNSGSSLIALGPWGAFCYNQQNNVAFEGLVYHFLFVLVTLSQILISEVLHYSL